MAKNADPKKLQTIESVAEVAGVSTMTVSRVLRGLDNVSAKTRTKVEKVIQESGYVHNRLAGALAASHASQVAVVIPTLQNIVFTEVLAGIAEALDGSAYQPIIGITEYENVKELELVKSMMGWRPAAFVLANTRHLDETVRILANANIPVVEVMEVTDQPIGSCVGVEQRVAGEVMASHLLEKGYRRFAYLGTNLDRDQAAAVRYNGFKSVLEAAGAALVGSMTADSKSGVNLGRYHLPELLEKHPDCEAVYFSNDAVAAGGMLYCLSAGIAIPDDLALAGYSGLDIGAALPHPLTTVRTPLHRMGNLAGQNILAQLRGEEVERITDAGFELIAGTSS